MLSANDMVFLLNSEGTFFLDVILPMAHTEALPRKWSQQDGDADFNSVGARTIGCSIQSFLEISAVMLL